MEKLSERLKELRERFDDDNYFIEDNVDEMIPLAESLQKQLEGYKGLVKANTHNMNEAIKLAKRRKAENKSLEKQLEELENALIPLIPVAFNGDKSAFQDEGFRDAFKSMILKSYLKVQRDELNKSK